MVAVTCIRDAKCKDCIFLKRKYIGKRKMHECELTNKQRKLNDLVCNDWKLQ